LGILNVPAHQVQKRSKKSNETEGHNFLRRIGDIIWGVRSILYVGTRTIAKRQGIVGSSRQLEIAVMVFDQYIYNHHGNNPCNWI
jgi:hypothetical protein